MAQRVIRFRRWMAVAAAGTLLFVPGLLQIVRLQERRRELQAEIAHLKAQNARMAEEMALLKEDPLHIERVARRKLGVAREGEILFRFPDDSSSP